MRLGSKLLAVPVGVAVIAFGAGGLNSVLMEHRAATDQARFAADLDAQRVISDARTQLGQGHALVYRHQAIADSLEQDQLRRLRATLAQQMQGLERIVGGAGELAAGSDAELDGHVKAAATLLKTYGRQVDKALELTEVEANMGVAAMQAAEVTYIALAQRLQLMLARRDELYAQELQAAQRRSASALLVLGGLGLLATAAAVAGGWLLQRRVLQQVARAVHVSTEVAAGRLGVRADSRTQDEIGDLLRSQGHMVEQLRNSLQTVRGATAHIHHAALEIASGNADLSRRTEQAAGSLQQTTSAMEEFAANVRQTAASAQTASDLANSASGVARRGGVAVSQVVATMDGISVAARRIGTIIATIDGIAFQTNLLALNAAVEAARAGEQGRGFAVVAGEVRGLAQRSAAAAREIKSLVDASLERVQAGNSLAGHAGRTMDEIVGSVQRVNDIISEISAAASEQSIGIQRVTSACVELDGVTQQNAALVEQSAAAAESLKEEAARLSTVVGAFQLGAAAPA
jgi:methyl-accepting chemotaxis protein